MRSSRVTVYVESAICTGRSIGQKPSFGGGRFPTVRGAGRGMTSPGRIRRSPLGQSQHLVNITTKYQGRSAPGVTVPFTAKQV